MAPAKLKPPFHADHVGSLLRPKEVIEARKAFIAGTYPAEKLQTLEDAAIRDAVALQERVGLQSITDGEIRRRGWREVFYDRVEGFGGPLVQGSFFFTEFSGERHRTSGNLGVVGRLKRKQAITAEDFAFLAQLTKRTAKATLPAPSSVHFTRGDDSLKGSPYADRRAFFADIAEIYRAEIADLVAAGCTYLQIDEVAIASLCDPRNRQIVRDERGEDADELIADYIAAINASIRNRPANLTVCVHLCRGNSGHGMGDGGYEPVAERLFNTLDVDGFFLEYDTSRSGGFEPLRFLPKPKAAVLGLMSTKVAELEPADVLKRRVDEAAHYADVERLGISPQCGFASSFLTDRFTVADEERKLAHLVKVADEIWG